MSPEWDAGQAVQVGYYGHIYSYRCARTIAQTIAGLAFRAGPDPANPGRWNPDAPLARLLGPPPGGPAPSVSPRQFWTWSILQYLLTGRWSWETELTMPDRNGQRDVVALWPIPGRLLKPKPSGKPGQWFDGYVYGSGTTRRDLRADQVVYCWRPSQDDWRQPESVLRAAALPLSVAVSMDRYMWAFMRNNMTASHLVVTPPFAETDMRRGFQDQFLAEMTGYDNAGRTAFAEMENVEGAHVQSVQVVPLGQTANDAQLLQLLQEVKRDVCIAWGVPVSLLGDASQRTYANADQEHRNFWTGTILPLVHEFQDAVNVSLSPRLGTEVGWFDLSTVAALRAPIFNKDTPSALVAAGIVEASEVRIDLGLPATPPTDASTEKVPEPAVDDTPGASGGAGMKRDAEPEGERWDSSKHPRIAAGQSGGGQFALGEGAGYSTSTPAGRAQHAAVKSIQRRLAKLGIVDLYGHKLAADGLFGPLTHSAVQSFQRAHGLKVTGAVDKATLAALKVATKGHRVKGAHRVKGSHAHHSHGRHAARHHSHGTHAHTHHSHGQHAKTHHTHTPRVHRVHRSAEEVREPVLETGSAGLLLPKGPIPKGPHLFRSRGRGTKNCASCGQGFGAKAHTDALTASRRKTRQAETRHAGAGHVPVPSGHATTADARRLAGRRQIDADVALFVPQAEQVLRDTFAAQARATTSRLTGRRGRQMLRKAGDAYPLVSASHVFDSPFWTAKLTDALRPLYAALQTVAATRVASSTGATLEADGAWTTDVTNLLLDRAGSLAARVNGGTEQALAAAIADGATAGESLDELSARVAGVFAHADDTRAALLARGEVFGALNAASHTVAAGLPAPGSYVKQWDAVLDDRTRPMHVLAHSQTQPLGEPFQVGDDLLQYPGDPAGTPDEIDLCRCAAIYLPAT